MMNTNDNKYYVFSAGWQGLSYEEMLVEEPDGIYDTEEKAREKIDNLYETLLAPDEAAYIIHNGYYIYQS